MGTRRGGRTVLDGLYDKSQLCLTGQPDPFDLVDEPPDRVQIAQPPRGGEAFCHLLVLLVYLLLELRPRLAPLAFGQLFGLGFVLAETLAFERAQLAELDKLMEDRVEQLKGLDAMVNTLNSLPEVRFPKGWEQLATNLESFSTSVAVVDKSVKALLEARATIEVLAPAVIARDLREVRERVTELSESGTKALDDIKASQDKLNENLEKWEDLPTRIIDGIREELISWHEESMRIVRTIQHDVSDVRKAAQELAPEVSRLADENSELTTKIAELSANSERVEYHVGRMGTSIDSLATITHDLKQEAGQQSQLLGGAISDLSKGSEIVGKELSGVREKLSEIWGLLRHVDELGESEDKRLDIIHRLRGIEERLEGSQRGLGVLIPEVNKIIGRSYRPRESPDEESGSP